jgi:hypothetical protein
MQPHRVRRHLQSPLRWSPDRDAGVKRPSRFAINDEMLVPVPQRCFRDPAYLTPTADTLDECRIWSIWHQSRRFDGRPVTSDLPQ